MWQNYLNALLGFVLAILAFVGPTGTTLTWTLFGFGLVILVVGLWGGIAASTYNEAEEHRHGHA